MSTKIVVVSAYDPATGWSTSPLAAVGWGHDWVWWDWVPMSEPARDLRYGVIENLDAIGQQDWLRTHLDDPSPTYSVSEVEVLDTVDRSAAEHVVRGTLDALLVAGA